MAGRPMGLAMMDLDDIDNGSSDVSPEEDMNAGLQQFKIDEKQKRGTGNAMIAMRSLFASDKIPVKGSCLKRLHIRKKLGAGNYGAVYLTNDDHGKLSVLKFIGSTELARVQQEQSISALAGKLGAGPKVYEHWICSSDQDEAVYIGMLNIELWTGTLEAWVEGDGKEWKGASAAQIQSQSKWIMDHLNAKLAKLHKHDIIHGDLHPKNVLLHWDEKNPGKIKDICISDYGLAKFMDEKWNKREKAFVMDKDSGVDGLGNIERFLKMELKKKSES